MKSFITFTKAHQTIATESHMVLFYISEIINLGFK